MTTLRYPSDAFPAPSSVLLDVPNDWLPIAGTSALIAVGAPPPEGSYRPNVIVTWSRTAPGFDIDQALNDLVERYRTVERDPEVIGTGEASVDGRSARLCEASFVHELAGTLVQSNLLLAVEYANYADLLVSCGTCAANQIEDSFASVRAAVRSLRLA